MWGPTPLGVVPTEGRGSLPFALWHGESLVAVASWSLAESGVTLLDFTSSWAQVVDASVPLVVHDPLCPTTPVEFLGSVVSAACPGGPGDPDGPGGPPGDRGSSGRPVLAGVRPVTDTVKEMASGLVGATVDRSQLVSLASPVVLPAGVVAALPDWPDLTNLPVLVARLAERFGVSFVEAPAEGRRIVDESDLRLLEATSR